MMTSDDRTPDLDELRRELEALGAVVVPFPDEIHVRRSTLEHIKVRVDGGTLRCEHYTGFLSQAQMTWALMAVESIVIPTVLFQFGVSQVGLMATFTGLVGFAFHALRYTLGEITVSRIQSVWLHLRERHRLALGSAPVSLPSPTSLSLPAGVGPVPVASTPQYIRSPK
jgi:hypothetical protein